jgi:hypothetical protein
MSNVTRTAPQQPSIKNTFLNTSTIGANQIIAAQTGMSIRVIDAAIVSTAANNVKFQSAANDISALFPLGANGGLVLPFNEHGWFQTNVGEALNINLSAATATGVSINYIIL